MCKTLTSQIHTYGVRRSQCASVITILFHPCCPLVFTHMAKDKFVVFTEQMCSTPIRVRTGLVWDSFTVYDNMAAVTSSKHHYMYLSKKLYSHVKCLSFYGYFYVFCTAQNMIQYTVTALLCLELRILFFFTLHININF